jgi:hypothetical protein
MLKKIIKNNARLFALALDWKEPKQNKEVEFELSEIEKGYLEELRKNGVVAIPNFFSEKECDLMIESFENIDNKYAHYYDNDKRIFGIEKLSPIHKQLFHDNEMFKRIGEAYIGEELILQTTMAAKISADNKVKYGSGGGWHRDSFSRQFKAIAYLKDVGIENGPFMYIKTSHTMENIKKVLFELKGHTPPSNYRYTDEEIEKIKEILNAEISYIIAPKGSLVLADIRGLHTGMKIEKDSRYSVFNYYIAKSFHQKNNNIENLANEY